MKNKKIKVLTFILAILQILIISSPVFAAGTNESVPVYAKKKLEDIKMNYYGKDIEAYYTVYKKDGVEYPVYCVNFEYAGVTMERSYNVQITDDYTNLPVWRAIINGYPFKTAKELGCANNDEAYAATKQAVFYMLYNRDITKYTYTGEPGRRTYEAMVKIINAASSSTQTQQDTKITLSGSQWKIDENNNKYLSKEITINCNLPISKHYVKIGEKAPKGTIITDSNNKQIQNYGTGKKFKILIPLENLKEISKFTIEVKADVNSYPMYYGKAPVADLQNYVLTAGIAKQEISTKTVEAPANKTKLVIEKKDKQGKKLEGVKFNVLDANNKIVAENLKTDKNGQIIVQNMVPGKYYIQEIETIKGYELNKDKVSVEIKYNEEKTVVVTNEKTPTPSPSPTPTPKVEKPSPSPSPSPKVEKPSPSPSPRAEKPSPSPSPTPKIERPSPSPSPSPKVETPSPTPVIETPNVVKLPRTGF